MEIMRSNVRTFVEQQQFSFETLWNKAVQSEQTQERIFRCCKNRFQYFANGIEKNNNKKNVFLYEYLSDKLERNDNRGIAKEQLKFNFTSSVPSTDNKKLNRCLDILVNLPKLFNKYSSKSIHGTGLGLNMSKDVVEAHDSEILTQNNKNEKGVNLFI